MQLNPSQQKAVQETEGAVMVLAGAGSGKTRTLVTRITHLLNEKQISPYQILALTFSNKAAGEMRDRIAAETGLGMGSLQVTTFHSFCAKVLRAEAEVLGLSKNFTIYDDSESRAIAKALLGKKGIELKEISPYSLLAYISEIKNRGFYKNHPLRLGLTDTAPDAMDELYPYY
ncbi:MAG: UvrD-helicase domain-containing protein, partial [Bacteriovoracaceae bacterium]|nr:UvrD-helicase domain-containing protein [Bacteriovoracaceae bacterium]